MKLLTCLVNGFSCQKQVGSGISFVYEPVQTKSLEWCILYSTSHCLILRDIYIFKWCMLLCFFRFSWYSQFEGLGIATIIFKKSNPLNKSTYQYIIGPRVNSNSFAYFTHPGFFYLKKYGKSSVTNHRLAVRLSLSLLRGFLSKRFSTEV